jgi:hypothetical protein
MNKNSEPKRHHFVPEMLSKRFVDNKGNIYYFDKRAPSKGVITGIPKNIFLETHLYTFEEKDGTKNTELEAFFSKLEGDADKIIEKIVTAARQGKKPNLTDVERKNWNLFFYYQWKRTPDVFRSVHSLVEYDDTYQKALTELESIRPLTQGERSSLEDIATKKRLKKGAEVLALSDPGSQVQEVLGKMGLGIVIIQNPKKSFVIGSKPVLKLMPKGSKLGDPTAEVWLPIAHDVLVGPGPINPNEERIIKIPDDKIREYNEAMFKQSKGIAGRSKELISSLASIARKKRN